MTTESARRTYDALRAAGASHDVAALKVARGNWNPYEGSVPEPDEDVLDLLHNRTCNRCGRALDPDKGEVFVAGDGTVTCNDHVTEPYVHPAIQAKIDHAKATAATIPARMRAMHDEHWPDCGTWETWTERNVPAILPTGAGRADFTYDGCREHHVAVARP